MLSDFEEKKDTFFGLKKKNFWKSKKSHFFKGVNPYFWSKYANYLVYLHLAKIRLEITFNNFVKEKKPFFTRKKNLLESPKNRYLPNGLTNALGQKMPIFPSIRFGQNKTRTNS